MSAPVAFSQKLMQCLISLELPEMRSDAKMELVLAVNTLMPEGRPDYLGMRKYEPIRDLVQKEGKKKMLAVLVLMVKDFCSSINVVRNMTEDQMIEAAAMLLEECGNFRLEDYLLMFAMAKRGHLAKTYDRIDIQLITAFLDEYWQHRKEAGERQLDNEVREVESAADENPADRKQLAWDDEKGYVNKETEADKLVSMAAAFEQMKEKLKQV